ILLVTIWSATLIPLLLMLIFFSSKRHRRTPIFLLNLVAIGLGMALGAVSIITFYDVLIDPDEGYNMPNIIIIFCLEFLTPFFAEFVLLCRLLAVYSFHTTPLWLFVSILCSLGCLKIARIINFIVFMDSYARQTKQLKNPLSIGRWSRLCPKLEWVLQTIDNAITSSLFLRQLNVRQALGCCIQNDGTNIAISSVSSKIKTLFWIAASNFVIPVFLNVALLIDIFHGSNFELVGSYLEYCNIYVQIIGVVLATLWAAGSQWLEDSGPMAAAGPE
ncbi:hypothetical protein AX14_005123, partial [Amanita brunnescens Koide BX004]